MLHPYKVEIFLKGTKKSLFSNRAISPSKLGYSVGLVPWTMHSINYKQANDIISLDFLATDDKMSSV
ncbi:hypothetical protein SCA6_006654 [Theobroma cacao]